MPPFLTRLINHTLSSSKDGVFSFARVGSAAALIMGIVWASYIVFTTKVIPNLDGVALLTTSLYGVNKISNAFSPKKDNDRPQV